MQFTLNRRSTVPMYRQLAAELREQILSLIHISEPTRPY